jgi:hypothetical protein
MRRNSFLEKYLKKLATTPAFVLLCPRRERAALTTHSTTTMIPFPADSAEYEEYAAAMEEMADLAESSTPDPEPPDDSHLDGNWEQYEDEGGEDSYLDAYWEDQSEYGMEGCCGDF